MQKSLFSTELIVKQSNIDLEMMQHHAHKWGVEREQTEKGLFSTSMRVVHTPHIQLGYALYSHGVMRKGGLPSGAILLGFVVGKESTSFKNKQLLSSELVYIDDGEEMDILSHSKSGMFVVVIEKKLFQTAFQNYFKKSITEVLKENRFIIDREKRASFVQGLSGWIEYLQSELFRSSVTKAYDTIESEMLSHIFSAIVFEDRRKERVKFQVERARDLLHESISKKVTIEQLVQELDISERQLHDAFKLNYGFTPKKYLHNLRLNAVRRELLVADPQSMNISNIAFKYGFTHMSHFSQEYKRMFEETPTETFQKK